jgi:predicted RNase H-like nuclease (RuvC/YqgF family)
MPAVTMDADQPTAREILDAVLHSQDVLATAIRRVEDDVAVLKTDVAVLKTDVAVLKIDVAVLKTDVKTLGESLYRLERRVIRIDDRLSVIEDLRLRTVLDDHERRIARLEGF